MNSDTESDSDEYSVSADSDSSVSGNSDVVSEVLNGSCHEMLSPLSNKNSRDSYDDSNSRESFGEDVKSDGRQFSSTTSKKSEEARRGSKSSEKRRASHESTNISKT